MKALGRFLLSVLSWGFSLGISLAVLGLLVALSVYHSFNKDLPDYSEMAKYDPPTATRLYAADGKLLAEYATEKRVFVPLSAIPKQVRNAFLSAEDKNFYTHSGVDISGIARAIRNNIINYGHGRSLVGGSTITQQVVKNFLLTSEKSLERKVKEAILAVRISQVYSKDKILELYLNEIYLGLGSYGVATAALNYFNKPLEELTIEEAALLASQPKAPTLYNPKHNYDAALERRNWVISRMLEDGHITEHEAVLAKQAPIALKDKEPDEVVKADFFAEEVRRKLAEMYGDSVLYEGGLVVKTTLNPAYQEYADHALQQALIDYDRRHGYRGALAKFIDEKELKTTIADLMKKHGAELLDGQKLARVKALKPTQADLQFADESAGILPVARMKWTGAGKPSDKLKVGDIIIVQPYGDESKKQYELMQVPQVNGALVVVDPHTGRVLAMSGGYVSGVTEFNRATQAKRQPGSAFKPFVYMAALENGFTPASILLDAPVEMSQGAGMPAWKPQNYGDDYLGPTTLRSGLEKSRNTMTVRLAQAIGIDKCLEIGKRMGIYDEPARNFSIVLGTEETTLLKLANAYGMIVNGGKQIYPSLIERIDDRNGKTIYRRDARKCDDCEMEIGATMPPIVTPPVLPDEREQVIDPRIAYQVTSMLEGVVERGTGTKAKVLGKVVGGKTGTTNESRDTWFMGFSPDLVVGTYVGFDKPRSLGGRETGGSVALPAFVNFMQDALKNVPNTPFRVPRGIKFVRIDSKSGWPISQLGGYPQQGSTILESFVTGGPVYVPGRTSQAVLNALNNLGTDFEPEEVTALPWQQTAPPSVIPAYEDPGLDQPAIEINPFILQQQPAQYAPVPTPPPAEPLPQYRHGGGLY